MYFSLFLSLSLYIYIYIYILLFSVSGVKCRGGRAVVEASCASSEVRPISELRLRISEGLTQA